MEAALEMRGNDAGTTAFGYKTRVFNYFNLGEELKDNTSVVLVFVSY